MGEILVNADATPTNTDGRGQVDVFILKNMIRFKRQDMWIMEGGGYEANYRFL